MNPAPLTIEVSGLDRAEATLQGIREALADRMPLHGEIAGNMLAYTRDHLVTDTEHRTANRLGATPTNFRSKQARALSSAADDDGAILRIPRNTGLGRAFGDITIRPGGGRKYLTIPAGPETYAKQPTDPAFPEGAFVFATIQTHRGPTPVLLWAETAGRHQKGEVAYWLRGEVSQKQNRELLPPDEEYRGLARDTIIAHIQNRIRQTSGAGPYGGTSTGMPG